MVLILKMFILVVIMLHYVIINIKLRIYIKVLDLSQGLAMALI